MAETLFSRTAFSISSGKLHIASPSAGSLLCAGMASSVRSEAAWLSLLVSLVRSAGLSCLLVVLSVSGCASLPSGGHRARCLQGCASWWLRVLQWVLPDRWLSSWPRVFCCVAVCRPSLQELFRAGRCLGWFWHTSFWNSLALLWLFWRSASSLWGVSCWPFSGVCRLFRVGAFRRALRRFSRRAVDLSLVSEGSSEWWVSWCSALNS